MDRLHVTSWYKILDFYQDLGTRRPHGLSVPPASLWFGVEGLRFGVEVFKTIKPGFMVRGLGFGTQGLELRV